MGKLNRVIILVLISMFLYGCDVQDDVLDDDIISTIEDVKAGSTGHFYTTSGIVIEESPYGLLVQDETGIIYVAMDGEGNCEIGDDVLLAGTTESYGGLVQLSSSTIVTVQESGSYTETRSPQELTESELETEQTQLAVGDLITVTGTGKINESMFILTFEQSLFEVYVITDEEDTSWTMLHDKMIQVTGYFVSMTNNQINLMLISFEEVPIPEVTFDEIPPKHIHAGEYTEIDWTMYIENPTSTVSNSFTYEVSDEVLYDTVGVYEVTIDVIDDLDNRTSQTFQVYVEDADNLVTNGSFDGGIEGWGFNNGNVEGGNGNIFYTEGMAAVQVITPVVSGWAPRLESSIIEFKHGQTYIVTFSAKAEEERTIGVQVGELLDDFPWFDDYLNRVRLYTVDTTWMTYSFIFTMEDPTGDGQLLFNMGELESYLESDNYNTTVYFDDITVKELHYPPELYGVYDMAVFTSSSFDPLQYVSAYDYEDGDITDDIVVIGEVDLDTPGTYTLTYEVTDSSGRTTSKERIITVIQASTIADVLNGDIGEMYIVEAIVVAIKYNGFLVTDGTDYIYVYTDDYHWAYYGDVVIIDGPSSTYGGVVQFGSDASYYVLGAGTYTEERTPVPYTGTDINTLKNDFTSGMLVEVQGTISIEGNYVNLVIDGTTIIGSLDPYDYTIDFASYDGMDVTITGYLLFFSGNNQEYMDIIVVSIEEIVQ